MHTAICTLAIVAAAANAQTITFELDAPGDVPNGFMSIDDLNVAFSDSMGEDLDVNSYGVQSDGQSLHNSGDDASAIIMDFTVNVSEITLGFGNDDANFLGGMKPWAWLVGYRDGSEVGRVGFESNGDDIFNETITLTGNFDQAEFYYGDSLGDAVGLIEIIDNITAVQIPAPGSLAVLGLGLFAAHRRR